ncbi:hypothetical protein BPC006_I1126 [Burkholderia pseudomallei BPC006]|nr:hypothetical protein BPC006_I1126 [Burkholderia pseudomallei BPC006]
MRGDEDQRLWPTFRERDIRDLPLKRLCDFRDQLNCGV